ncbi:MAG: sugar-binding protein, partial [Armatimonadota bacterium]
MRNSLLVLLLVALALPAWCAERVSFYTTWDDTYIYVGFDVQDADVQSANRTHMSNPWEDDDVEVQIQRGGSAYRMAVSAGAGSSFLVNDTPKKIFTFKYAAKVQGRLNSPQDMDMGYTVELAIPWSEMGGAPAPGEVIGFDALCRSQGGASVNFSSDGKMKLVDTPTVVSMEDGALICRKVFYRAPVIDGNLSQGEWLRDIGFHMTKPSDSAVAVRAPVERIIVAAYSPVLSSGAHHPLSGTWLSDIERQKSELREAAVSGIDAVRPLSDDPAQLAAMVQALKELKAAGDSYPLVDSASGLVPDELRLPTDTGGAVVVSPGTDVDVYKASWEAALAQSPDIILVDSWNNFPAGNEVCRSVENGVRYVDLTWICTARANGMRDYRAKFLRHDAPRVVPPGGLSQVTFVAKNAGTRPWQPGKGISISARWFKDGVLVADSGARLPIQEKVPPGTVLTKMVGVRAITEDGRPLSEGEYELRIEMQKGGAWFSNDGSVPLSIPVTVGTPAAPAFTLVGTDLPALAKPNGTYKVKARLRNDGSTALEPGAWKIMCGDTAVPLVGKWEPGKILEITVD